MSPNASVVSLDGRWSHILTSHCMATTKISGKQRAEARASSLLGTVGTARQSLVAALFPVPAVEADKLRETSRWRGGRGLSGGRRHWDELKLNMLRLRKADDLPTETPLFPLSFSR